MTHVRLHDSGRAYGVRFAYNPRMMGALRKIDGAEWDALLAEWAVPLASGPVLRDALQAWPFEWAPEARRMLGGMESRVEMSRASTVAPADDMTLTLPEPMRSALFPYQRAGVRYATLHPRCMIADEMGLGKTIQAIATMELTGSYPAVVVCPASVKIVWEAELRRWCPWRSVAVLSGRAVPSDLLGDAGFTADVTIINHDVLDPWADWLAVREPAAVVFDEARMVKSVGAKRSGGALKVASTAKRVLLLDGTPLAKDCTDLMMPLRLLDVFRRHWPTAKAFQDAYGNKKRPPSSAMLDGLQTLLRAECMVRRTKDDVVLDLPEKRRCVVPVEMAPAAAAEYASAVGDFRAWCQKNPVKPGQSAMGNTAKMSVLRQVAARAKLPAAAAWCEEYARANSTPLLVFGVHRKIVGGLLLALTDAGVPAAVLNGDTPMDERKRLVERFQANDPGLRVLICNVVAGGSGLTLTAARDSLFVEVDFRADVLAQAEDRIHRVGSVHESVGIHYMLADGTVDVAIAASVARKKALARAVVGTAEEDMAEGAATAEEVMAAVLEGRAMDVRTVVF